jgi:hypothetical protein
MRRLAALLLVGIGLTGCANRHAPATYGNFIDVPEKFDGTVMADDVAGKMVALFPPARTSIKMRQTTLDAFGATLTAALRAKGYALAEFDPDRRAVNVEAGAPIQPPATDNLALAYLVDQPLDAGLYRVTILINEQSLSRLYQAKDGSLVPAGYWVRKE